MIYILIIAILGVDQITKYLVRANFTVGQSLPVIRNVFHITYVRNTGAAFSMFQNLPIVTVALPIVLLIVCGGAIFYFKKNGDRLAMVCTSMILAGGIGNLIDRLMLGYVTDMFDFRVFPVFNVADIAVTCGCALMIIWALKSGKEA